MVRTRQTDSLQLSGTPWTHRRKRKIWSARRTIAATLLHRLFRIVVEETAACLNVNSTV